MFNVVKAAFHAVLRCNPIWNIMNKVPRSRWVWLLFHCVLYVPNFWCLEHFAVLTGVPWWNVFGVTFFGTWWAEFHGGKVPGKIVGVTTTVRCMFQLLKNIFTLGNSGGNSEDESFVAMGRWLHTQCFICLMFSHQGNSLPIAYIRAMRNIMIYLTNHTMEAEAIWLTLTKEMIISR